jgi:hypothetical protein
MSLKNYRKELEKTAEFKNTEFEVYAQKQKSDLVSNMIFNRTYRGFILRDISKKSGISEHDLLLYEICELPIDLDVLCKISFAMDLPLEDMITIKLPKEVDDWENENKESNKINELY